MQVNECIVENNVAKIINGVKTIQRGILPLSISKVIIPSTVSRIDERAVLCDALYDGILVTIEEIQNYGSENIIRIATFKKYQLDYTKLPEEVFKLLPLTNDAIKGYMANSNHYLCFRKEINKEFETLFKVCYTLGLFTVPDKTKEQVKLAIIEIFKYPPEKRIGLKNIELKEVSLKFVLIVLEIFRSYKLDKFLPYYEEFYSNEKEICRTIRMRKENLVREKNKQRKELEESQQNTDDITKEINRLKENSKKITLDDIVTYFENYSFTIREGNEALEAIMPIVREHIPSQKSFDILQDIYEEAKSKKEEASKIFSSLEGKVDEYTYKWLESDDYLNLVLGYLVNCCAKLEHAGEDVMRYSMTNPQVRTLVVYDGFNKIIGKSTFFYSLEGKYLLGNNIEVANSFAFSHKTSEKQKEKLLETILEGLKAQITAMDKIGYIVNEVRIGMLRNNLYNQMQRFQIETNDLLPNIKYGTYIGDASNSIYGQAIIPIEKEVRK